jgi:hypothetical protein
VKSLSFYPELHEYHLYDEDTGAFEIPPSASAIASAVTGKDLSRIPAATLKAATDRGNSIHREVETRFLESREATWVGRTIELSRYRSEVMGYAEVAGFYFTGTCDLVADDGDAVLIEDIKSEAKKATLYWTIQLNLYARIFAAGRKARLFVLHVPKTGRFERIPIKVLPEDKIREIIEAFKEGRTVDNNILSEQAPGELDLVVSSMNLGVLTTNARAIYEAVKAKVATYKPENYGPDDIPACKRDKAELNSASKRLNDKRIELERKFMEPFVEFKDIVRQTTDLIDSGAKALDAVVTAKEAEAKEQKRAEIEAFWVEQAFNLITLDQVFDPSWLNLTAKKKGVEEAIVAKIAKVKDDLAILGRVGEEEAQAYYLTTLNLDAALKKADEVKAARERLAAAKPAPIAPEPAPIPEPEAPVTLTFERTPDAPVQDDTVETVFRVRCTVQQRNELASYMRQAGIAFEKIAIGEEKSA